MISKVITKDNYEKFLAGEEGFEPSHAGIKIQCLNQLGDSPTLANLRWPKTCGCFTNLLLPG
jgi:hypothetical protein